MRGLRRQPASHGREGARPRQHQPGSFPWNNLNTQCRWERSDVTSGLSRVTALVAVAVLSPCLCPAAAAGVTCRASSRNRQDCPHSSPGHGGTSCRGGTSCHVPRTLHHVSPRCSLLGQGTQHGCLHQTRHLHVQQEPQKRDLEPRSHPFSNVN